MIDESQLARLPVDEKLRIVTNLWNQIAGSEEAIKVPDAVLDDAGRRISEMTSDPSRCITEDEMWRQADGLR
jgi:putative addiction module component (TIGR02574 family)